MQLIDVFLVDRDGSTYVFEGSFQCDSEEWAAENADPLGAILATQPFSGLPPRESIEICGQAHDEANETAIFEFAVTFTRHLKLPELALFATDPSVYAIRGLRAV